MANHDQNGHLFDFETNKCFHCGMTFTQLDDADMPRCQGMPSSLPSQSDEPESPAHDRDRWGVRIG